MNNKGQVMIEGLFLGIVLTLSLFFLLKYSLTMLGSTLVDEFSEQALICSLTKNENCTARLQHQMKELGYSKIQVQLSTTQKKNVLNLKATSGLDNLIEKESEIYFDHLTAK